MQAVNLKVKGLYTNPSDLSDAPQGALTVADNIIIDKDDIAEPRRGFGRSYSGFTGPTDTAQKFAFYQNYLFAHLTSNLLVYYTTKLDSTTANFTGTGSWTTAGSVSAPSGTKMRFATANQNLYFTTSQGIYKLDAHNNSPVPAGGYKGLDVTATIVTPSSGTWLASNYSVAYRVVWGIKDANQNLILGAPSSRAVITNTGGSLAAVQLKVLIPSGVTTAWFFQIYRSASINGTPTDELGLVYEANPTSTDISNGYVALFNDIVPDVLRGAMIYTAASQQGLANSYERPPLAKDIAVYRNVTFYANTLSKQRLYLNMLAVGGTNGVQHGDTLTVGGQVFTAQFNTENAASKQFAIDSLNTTGNITNTSNQLTNLAVTTGIVAGQSITGTGIPNGTTVSSISGTTVTMSANATATTTGLAVTFSTGASVSQAIQDATDSLCRVVNQNASCTVYAFDTSIPTTLPGQLLFEERSIGGGTFTATGANTTAWSPSISGSGASSTNDVQLNALYYSLTSQPEAVPLGNYFFVGSADKQILRILPLRDSLFILKEDGVFRLSGLDINSFRVDPFDPTTHLLASESAVVLNNQVFAFTDQGVVSISESGVQVKSRPIEYDLLSLQGQNYSVLQTASFGVAYDTERKYILFVPTLAADTTTTQAYVFNVFTNTWTRWPMAKTCGLVNPGPVGDNKLYLGDATTNYVNQERKSYSYQDYVDYGFQATISAVSGTTLTISNSDKINVGDVIYQSSSAYSTVTAVNTVTGTVTTSVIAPFSAGPTDVLKAISTKIQWVPVTQLNQGVPYVVPNPGFLKQFREVSVIFKSDFTGNATLTFTSDTNPSQETETLTGTPVGTWGLFPWGLVNWGGTNTRRPIRVYVPTDMQRCSQLTIGFQQSTGYAAFQLQGLSLVGNMGSEKVAY